MSWLEVSVFVDGESRWILMVPSHSLEHCPTWPLGPLAIPAEATSEGIVNLINGQHHYWPQTVKSTCCSCYLFPKACQLFFQIYKEQEDRSWGSADGTVGELGGNPWRLEGIQQGRQVAGGQDGTLPLHLGTIMLLHEYDVQSLSGFMYLPSI